MKKKGSVPFSPLSLVSLFRWCCSGGCTIDRNHNVMPLGASMSSSTMNLKEFAEQALSQIIEGTNAI
jgi:hypothetical protein